MKVTKTLNDVLADHNIHLAIEFLKTKKNACGDDGIWLHDLDTYWNLNKQIISNQIFNKTYKPQIVHEKIIVMANGKYEKLHLCLPLTECCYVRSYRY